MKYFFANWKMYVKEREAKALAKITRGAKSSKHLSVAVFPSAIHIPSVRKLLGKKISFGAQDIGPVEYGAATGEISAVEVKEMKGKYALVGHSERRHAGESDALIAQKFSTAVKSGLIPVLCVGETEAERVAGKETEVVRRQLKSALADHKAAHFFVAYEPVWAIGTGISASYADVTEMHLVIRKELSLIMGESGQMIPIVYGGSVAAENVAEYVALPAVDGVLVGGASTKPVELKAMLQILCS